MMMRNRQPGDLKQYFIYKLETLYANQRYLYEQFPFLIESAYAERVKDALETHRHVTIRQIIRLKAIFEHLSINPRPKRASVVKKMIKESKWMLRRSTGGAYIRDNSLILAWRQIDHFHIASYAGLIGLSSSLALRKVSESLYRGMEEEMDADTSLRELSGNGHVIYTAESENPIILPRFHQTKFFDS